MESRGFGSDWFTVFGTIFFPGTADDTIYRLTEGISRFFITDINNPAGSAQAESTVAVMWDIWVSQSWDENTGLIAERYRKLGGKITLIAKPGVGHHPHGLDDPRPIVEFIVSSSWLR